VVFEDEHLLVVNKPPGWNTHAPSPYAGEGIYEWLKHREPRWSDLAIIHRLDKETSGLLVFGKTPVANRSLSRQFENREVRKVYCLVTDRPVEGAQFDVVTAIVRIGDRYAARPVSAGADIAETGFRILRKEGRRTWLEAFPKTGRTHQIRVHAAHRGFPIFGDELYGGAAADRLHLMSAGLEFKHPESGVPLSFQAPTGFDRSPAAALRDACIVAGETDAFRCLHGAADGRPDLYADKLGEYLLTQSGSAPEPLSGIKPGLDANRYHKRLNRHVRASDVREASPIHVQGAIAPERFQIRENGVAYELSFNEGYSVGIFLDQRDNRRRLLVKHVAADFPLFSGEAGGHEVLNCFAYTCAFSVCAALGGARVTSLDLSKKYLDWGRRNFEANGLDPAAHDFIYGDVFDWLRRLAKKGRQFDAVLLDPPTFSRSKEHGDFRAERDYGALAVLALKLLKPGGVMFASTNAARLDPERFLEDVRSAISASGRRVLASHYAPQPPDFPVSREEPAYLKTVWTRVS
jgi:23S rRNA (cytosine1962-C5)-methyltransferase